jgi:hypothetical protein
MNDYGMHGNMARGKIIKESLEKLVSKANNPPSLRSPEFQQRLRRRRHPMIGPRQKVELGDSAGLVRAEILQVEASHQIVFAPDMFGHQMHLNINKSAFFCLSIFAHVTFGIS